MDQFCTACGHQLHPDERFCGGCGHPVGAPVPTATGTTGAPPPTAVAFAPSPAPPAPSGAPGRGWWWVVVALAIAITVVIAAGVAIWIGGRDDPEPVVVPAPVTTASTTSTTTTTRPTTVAPTTAAPTTAAPPPFDPGPVTTAFFVPEEALADWAWSTGLNYQGECASLSSTADYGVDPWCATLWEDRGATLVYRVADFPGGDFAFWVLVGTSEEGWVVREAVDDQTGRPPF